MKKVKIIITLLMIIAILFILMPKSNAALQSNGSAGTKQKLNDWIINIRKMEGLGGTLGLTETLNTDLTSSSGSNNLDIHMEKNTEYGAIAILSASSYGNPNKIASGDTTTGNETGIVMNLNVEVVSAGQVTEATTYVAANKKYKDNYTTTYVAKKGDAISETAGWHGGINGQYWMNTYITSASRVNTLIRAKSGSIFAYSSDARSDSEVSEYRTNYSRAIMICGEGI